MTQPHAAGVSSATDSIPKPKDLVVSIGSLPLARYTVLAEIEAMPEVKGGAEFRMVDLTQRILDNYLTPEQQQLRIKKANSDGTDPLHSIVKFFASFIAKQNDLFVRVRPGIYRAHSEDELAAVEEGITDAQIDLMAKTNPAKALGLQ